MKRVLVVIGTSREAVRVAPVVIALRERADCAVGVCIRLREDAPPLGPVLTVFGIEPALGVDFASRVPAPAAPITAVMDYFGAVYRAFAPDLVLVAGASTTGTAATLAAHDRRIPVGKLQAGLRSDNDAISTWPEEMNRRVTDALGSILFASTARSRDNLVREGVLPERIVECGNTGSDALATVASCLQRDLSLRLRVSLGLSFLDARLPLVLVACSGQPCRGRRLDDFCRALRGVARQHPEAQLVYAGGADPDGGKSVHAALRDVPGVELNAPLDFVSLVYLMLRASLIVADSDELRDEALALGKPLVVAGTARSTGADGSMLYMETDAAQIVAVIHRLLETRPLPRCLDELSFPPHEPRASHCIVQALLGDSQAKMPALAAVEPARPDGFPEGDPVLPGTES